MGSPHPVPRTDHRGEPDRVLRWPRALAAGAGTLLLVLMLGCVTRQPVVAELQLGVEHAIARERTGVFLVVAHVINVSAAPSVAGFGAVVLVPAVLLLRRRWLGAARVLGVLGGALGIAHVLKVLVGTPRPPVSLWAEPVTNNGSFPSGHTTCAAAITIVLVLLAVGGAWRRGLALTGALYTVAVAMSRVYVGNHFLLDVVGGVLTAVAAWLLTVGIIDAAAFRTRGPGSR